MDPTSIQTAQPGDTLFITLPTNTPRTEINRIRQEFIEVCEPNGIHAVIVIGADIKVSKGTADTFEDNQ